MLRQIPRCPDLQPPSLLDICNAFRTVAERKVTKNQSQVVDQMVSADQSLPSICEDNPISDTPLQTEHVELKYFTQSISVIHIDKSNVKSTPLISQNAPDIHSIKAKGTKLDSGHGKHGGKSSFGTISFVPSQLLNSEDVEVSLGSFPREEIPSESK